MHVLNGHFEKGKLVLDDPVPKGLSGATHVRVTIKPVGPSKALASIAAMAVDAPDLPTDLSANHDKYLYGQRKP